MTPLSPPPSAAPCSEYHPIPIGHIFPNTTRSFEIYLRHGDSHVLFATSGELFTAKQRSLLEQHGVDVVYIHRDAQDAYREYMRRHLAGALLGDDMGLREKAVVCYHNTCDIVRTLIRDRLPQGIGDAENRLFMAYVRASVEFLATEAGLARLAAIMKHDYEVYSHGVHVFVYTVFLLRSLGLPAPTIVQAGVGALLHDAGKEDVPLTILHKSGRLSPEEFLAIREHPVLGIKRCRNLSLSRLARDCILMHHEKLDGQGYPRGISGEAIPLHVRVVSLADAYDALTSKRVYAGSVRPFEALRIMRDNMAGSFDLDLYKRFVMLLSGAGLA